MHALPKMLMSMAVVATLVMGGCNTASSVNLLKSTDRGRTWASITGNLPEREIVWRLVQDHEKPELLFVGTEMGVYFSPNGGERWVELSGGVPNISFRDLAIQ